MTCPFKIFPTSAYLNDQLSIVSDYDNLIVKFYFNEEEKMSINLNSNFSSILSKLNIPGSYKAVCEYDGVIYEQYIYVKDAYRLGTSELKKAYLFACGQNRVNFSQFL